MNINTSKSTYEIHVKNSNYTNDSAILGNQNAIQASEKKNKADFIEKPKAQPGLRGTVVKHVANNGLQSGETVPNPFEITITESLLGLWQAAFYSQDRIVTSQLYAQKLGLAPKGQSSAPFMMGLFLAVCMSETHGALCHLGFRNARQHAPIYTGLTVRQNIIIKSIQLTSNKKNSIITTRRELIDASTGKILFTVEKLELYPALDYVVDTRGSFNVINELYDDSIKFFKSNLLSHCSADKNLILPKVDLLPLQKGQLILHSFARPLGIDTNLALSTWFKVTHPIHLDHHLYEDSDTKGVVVSGGLVQALTIAASSRDFQEVVWEELIQGDNLATVGARDTIGAISYIMERKVFDSPMNYEELTVRTYGLKNISPASECAHLDFPFELFEDGHKRPSEYERILEEAGAYWLEGKLATVITRKIIRLLC